MLSFFSDWLPVPYSIATSTGPWHALGVLEHGRIGKGQARGRRPVSHHNVAGIQVALLHETLLLSRGDTMSQV